MKRCEKCNIDLDIISNKCPLCNSEIEDIKNFESSYPPLMPIIDKHLFRKILLLIVSLISITVVAVNYFLTPKFKWSIFVILQLIASYRVFYNILSGRRKVIKLFLMFFFKLSMNNFILPTFFSFIDISYSFILSPTLIIRKKVYKIKNCIYLLHLFLQHYLF